MELNSSKKGRVVFGDARLVAGSVTPPAKDGSQALVLDRHAVRFQSGLIKPAVHVEFLTKSITEFELLGVGSRYAARLAALGLTGAGVKKDRTWLRVAEARRDAVFELRVAERQARGWCSQFKWARLVQVEPEIGQPVPSVTTNQPLTVETKWEYLVERFPAGLGDRTFEDELDELGEESWELIDMRDIGDHLVCYFKRPLV